jgi:hypothetical protein
VHINGASCTFSGIFSGPDSGPGFRVKNLFKVDKNDSKTMYENGDFKVTASCENNGGGDLTADTTLRAKKRHLLAYYYRVSQYLLPFLKDRPLVLQRHPNGVNAQGGFSALLKSISTFPSRGRSV